MTTEHSISYVECTLPEGLTLAEYRRSRRRQEPRPRLRLRRRRRLVVAVA
jgi:hypothetical protein